jgi:anti-sigma B factor antagonist
MPAPPTQEAATGSFRRGPANLPGNLLDFVGRHFTMQVDFSLSRGDLAGSASTPEMPRTSEGVFMSSQPRRQRLQVEDTGDVTVVHFTDKKILDEQNIQIIGEQLFSLVDELDRKRLLLNFGNVEYLSSAALGKLITLNKKVNAVNGKLVLCNIDPQIYEVFEITKLNRLFNIQKDEQAALQAF